VPQAPRSDTLFRPGPLAQLARALPSHGRGHWFESSTAHSRFAPLTSPGPFGALFVPSGGRCTEPLACSLCSRPVPRLFALLTASSTPVRFAHGQFHACSLCSRPGAHGRWFVMPAVRNAPLLTRQRVRFRCLLCEVAWTAEEDPGCWMCSEPGYNLRAALALREDDHLHLDFD
jgi:hypothetical protein